MKYFIDTEFIERPGSIQLISIGIVAEDKRAFYAVSKEFDLKAVWQDDWLREKVLKSIYKDNTAYSSAAFTRKTIEVILKSVGRTNASIASDIIKFINPDSSSEFGCGMDQVVSSFTRADAWQERYYPKEFEYIRKHNTFMPDTFFSTGVDGKGEERNRPRIYNQPEFYGYYADYDWVVFCWLFGKMINLPKGFPMYCRDLKQMMDDRGLSQEWKQGRCPAHRGEHNALIDAEWNRRLYDEMIKHDILSGKNLSVPSTSYVDDIIKLSKLSEKKLRTINNREDRLYHGPELTKNELIYQLAFKMHAPKN
jgi:hypothetical protein